MFIVLLLVTLFALSTGSYRSHIPPQMCQFKVSVPDITASVIESVTFQITTTRRRMGDKDKDKGKDKGLERDISAIESEEDAFYITTFEPGPKLRW